MTAIRSIRIPALALLLLAMASATQAAADPAVSEGIESSSQAREEIEQLMESHPDDPALQAAGAAALQAMRAWEAELTGRQAEPAASALPDEDSSASRTFAAEVQGPFPNLLSGLDTWNIDENYVGVAIADADWTIDEVFPGTKLIFEAQYSIRRGIGEARQSNCDCVVRPVPTRMVGTLGAHLQWGKGETDLEMARLSFTSVSYQRNFEPVVGRLMPLRDTLEIGEVLGGRDDPLGVESYVEVTLARVGRTWSYITNNQKWMYLLGAGMSAGYAWAESLTEDYNEVKNPVIGTWVTLGIYRPRWGKIYVEQRVENGFQFSSPSAGGSTSRAARFRFGYMNRLKGCLNLEIFWDKRSFNFSDHRLPDLYTKSRRVGAELGCAW